MPGFFGVRQYSSPILVDLLLLNPDGIFGPIIRISATLIFAFLTFGAFLLRSGAGEVLTRLAIAATGTMTGGMAKAAVVASAIIGTCTQSPASNVATTGSFTIPMMKKSGYQPHFAGGVEAVASTGSQIMPPVMGSVAFIMSELAGIPYGKIIVMAALPAVLYYAACFLQTHFRAVQDQLAGLPKAEVPPLGKTLREGWQFLLPLVVLIYLLVSGYTPMKSALFATGAIIVIDIISGVIKRKSAKQMLATFGGALHLAATSMLVVIAGVAIAALAMTSIIFTGAGEKFAFLVSTAAGESVLLALTFGMVACIILGMGVNVIVSYVLTALMIVPTLISGGVAVPAAHLFVIYFAAVAFITPPVCPAAFVAASIAGSNPLRTGFTAARLGIAGFVLPFIFVYRNGLLLIGSPTDIITAIVCACFSVLGLAVALEGKLAKGIAGIFERSLLIVSAITLVYPNLLANVAAGAVIAIIVTVHYKTLKGLERPNS